MADSRACFSSRRSSGFAAPLYVQGFTPILQREPHLNGHLAHGLPTVQGRFALLSVWSFVSPAPAAPDQLLRPLLTPRSVEEASKRGLPRRPFKHKARSPRIRTVAFVAQPPDFRRFPLVARAPRSLARSPWSTAPHIRFLFVGSRLRYTASFSAALTVRRLTVHFGPCDQVPGGLPPPDYRPYRAYQKWDPTAGELPRGPFPPGRPDSNSPFHETPKACQVMATKQVKAPASGPLCATGMSWNPSAGSGRGRCEALSPHVRKPSPR